MGAPFSVTVTALDVSNATVSGYTGTVHFTTSAGSSTLPADYTFVAGDNGTHTFSVTLNSSGTQTVTATDTAIASITGSASTNVLCPPGPAPSANATNSGPACAGSSVNLFASGTGTIYSWTGPGGFTSTQQNPTGVTVAGTYTVTVSSPGPCSSSASASTTVVFNTSPEIITQPTGQIVNPGNNATFTVVASGGNLHYQWFVRHPSGITLPVGTDAPSYSTNPEGNAWWFVRITNICGQVDSDSVNARVVTPRHRPSNH